MVVAFGAFMFTGCDALAEELPIYDTWYRFEKETNNAQLVFFVNYQRDGITTDKIKADVDFVDGLNILITATTDTENAAVQTICDGLTNKTFILKTFPEGEAAFGGLTMGKGAWATMYEYIKTLDSFEDNGSVAPEVLKTKGAKSLDFSEGYDWKTLLAQALIASVL